MLCKDQCSFSIFGPTRGALFDVETVGITERFGPKMRFALQARPSAGFYPNAGILSTAPPPILLIQIRGVAEKN